MSKSEIDSLIGVPKTKTAKLVKYLGLIDIDESEYVLHSDYVQFRLPINKAERLFMTEFYQYTSALTGLTRDRIAGPAYLPSKFKDIVQLVTGISDFIEDIKLQSSVRDQMKSHLKKVLKSEDPVDGRGHSGRQPVVPLNISPATLRQYYNVPANLTATNPNNIQSIAAFYDFYSNGALAQFDDLFSVDPSLVRVKPLSESCFPNCLQYESNLDVQYMTAMGLNVSTFFLSMSDTEWILDWALAIEQVSPLPMVSSISYGYTEIEQCNIINCTTLGYTTQTYINRTNTEFMKLGLMGMSVLVASGDFGSMGLYGAGGNCPLSPTKYCELGGCASKYSVCQSVIISAPGQGSCIFPAGQTSDACSAILSTADGSAAVNNYISANSGLICRAALQTDTLGNYHISTPCPCLLMKPVVTGNYTARPYFFSKSNGPMFNSIYPGSSPFVTSVGATIITNATKNAEIAASIESGAIITTGGGFSVYQSQPSYQSKAVSGYLKSSDCRGRLPPAFTYNRGNRAYPDITLVGAKYIVAVSDDGSDQCPCSLYLMDGTSASSPALAGLVSLLNDKLLNSGRSQLGFLNPLLYQAAAESPKSFNDITSGNTDCNSIYCCQYGFPATKGWDVASGLGSINFSNLEAYIMSSCPNNS